MTDSNKKKVLFLCTGNSCRSQMAEGWGKALCSSTLDCYSAGIQAHGLNPNAVAVMAEAGVDISSQKSQLLSDIDLSSIDLVISVCSHADQNCPVLNPSIERFTMTFDDPPALAKAVSSDQEKLEIYRRVRDEIKGFVESLPARSGL